MPKKILIIATKGDSTKYLYNFLKKEFDIQLVILEDKISRKKILKSRVKRIGFLKVLGQILFMVFVPKILSFSSRNRKSEIINTFNLSDEEVSKDVVKHVDSINSNESLDLIKNSKVDFIVVNGTRIISSKILSSNSAPFINIHAGITPKYRGVHGGYWALAQRDEANCGVTVHVVDSGIDTGTILKQANIEITRKDNFTTYPILQQALGLRLLKEIFVEEQNLEGIYKTTLPSKLWYHPTLFEYLVNRITKNIK